MEVNFGVVMGETEIYENKTNLYTPLVLTWGQKEKKATALPELSSRFRDFF